MLRSVHTTSCPRACAGCVGVQQPWMLGGWSSRWPVWREASPSCSRSTWPCWPACSWRSHTWRGAVMVSPPVTLSISFTMCLLKSSSLCLTLAHLLLLLLSAELSCELDSRFPDRNTAGETLELWADLWVRLNVHIITTEGKVQWLQRGGREIH